MSLALQIAFNRPRRIALALVAAASLAWIGTFALLKADASPSFVVLLSLVLATGVLMQTLAPGAGFARRRTTPTALLPSADLEVRLHEMASGSRGHRPPFALVLLELEPDQETEPEPLARIAADRLAQTIRRGDAVGQVGALSFAVVLGLAESDRLELYAAGARLANAISGGSREGKSLTASFGFAMHYRGMTVENLFDEAATALEANRTRSGRVGVYRRFRRGRTQGTPVDPPRPIE